MPVNINGLDIPMSLETISAMGTPPAAEEGDAPEVGIAGVTFVKVAALFDDVKTQADVLRKDRDLTPVGKARRATRLHAELQGRLSEVMKAMPPTGPAEREMAGKLEEHFRKVAEQRSPAYDGFIWMQMAGKDLLDLKQTYLALCEDPASLPLVDAMERLPQKLTGGGLSPETIARGRDIQRHAVDKGLAVRLENLRSAKATLDKAALTVRDLIHREFGSVEHVG